MRKHIMKSENFNKKKILRKEKFWKAFFFIVKNVNKQKKPEYNPHVAFGGRSEGFETVFFFLLSSVPCLFLTSFYECFLKVKISMWL